MWCTLLKRRKRRIFRPPALRQGSLRRGLRHRRLVCEPLEDRRLLSASNDSYATMPGGTLHAGLVNGTFETDDLTGWATFTAPGGTLGGPGFPDVVSFDAGGDGVETLSVQLLVGDGGGGISQSVELAGGTARITADVAAKSALADPEGGLFELLLDGQVVASHDFGAMEEGQTERAELDATLTDVTAGEHEIRIRVTRSQSSAYGSSPFSFIDDVIVYGNAGGVLSNDQGPDGVLLESRLVTLPEHGTLELNPDGSFRYVPDSGFSGEDSFVYKAVTEGKGLTLYSVDHVNDKLVAFDAATGQLTIVGSIYHDMGIVDMTYMYQAGALYALNVSGDDYELVSIDPLTGSYLSVVPITSPGKTITAAKGITALGDSLYVVYAEESAYCGDACDAAHILGRLDPATGVLSPLVNYRSLDGGFNHDFHTLATDPSGRIIGVGCRSHAFITYHLGFDPPSISHLGTVWPPDPRADDAVWAGTNYYVLNPRARALHRYDPGLAGYTRILENISVGLLGDSLSGLAYAPDFETNTATVTIAVEPGSIHGQKYNDLDANGQRDPGEPGLEGWTIYLDADDNGQWDAGETTTQTDVSGHYTFPLLGPGPHVVREMLEEGWEQTAPAEGYYRVTFAGGQEVTGRDFGNYLLNQPPTLDPISDPPPIDVNAAAQTVNLTGISAGVGETQELRVTATSDDPELIADPAVTYTSPDTTGSLSYTPVTDQSGIATITVTVTDAGVDGILETDDDGTFSQQFTVTVSSLKIDLALIPVLTPSPPSLPGSALPAPLSEVTVGSTYYLEVWVQDTGLPSAGVTGGMVDLGYTTALADATAVVNLDFDIVASGTIDEPGGLVDNLGGGTLGSAVAVSPDWARLAYVELVCTAVGDVTFQLSPGALEFSRFAEGLVPWSEVDLSDVATVQQTAGPRVDMTLVREPTSFDDPATGEVDTLPGNLPWLDEWGSSEGEKGPIYVEIWGHTPMEVGIRGFSLDLAYDTDVFTATSIEHGPALKKDQAGSIDDVAGSVYVAATTPWTDVGAGRNVLLARVSFEAAADDPGAVHNAQGQYITPLADPAFSLLDVSVELVDSAAVAPILGEPPDTQVWPVMYDIDDDGRVAFGDLAFFATAFQQKVGDPGADFAWASDFDRSERVDFGDLAFFAANFGRVKTDDVPLVYPANFPDDWEPAGLEGSLLDGLEGSLPDASQSPAGPSRLHDAALAAYLGANPAGASWPSGDRAGASLHWDIGLDSLMGSSSQKPQREAALDQLFAGGPI